MTADLALSIRPVAEPARTPRAQAVPAEAETPPAKPTPVIPNPRLRLDAPLGMVVLEFRDAIGDLANTIPSPRQMAAYRAAAVSDAPMPVGLRERRDPVPEPPPAPQD